MKTCSKCKEVKDLSQFHGQKTKVSACKTCTSKIRREGYQVLCSNCNRGRWRNGGECPHKVIAEALFTGKENSIRI
jgi:hypothetical protein